MVATYWWAPDMNTQALRNRLELEPVRGRKVSSIFNIVGVIFAGFVQCIKLGECLLALFWLVPDFDPILLFCSTTSLNDINDMLCWVGIRRARCSVPIEVVQDLSWVLASCNHKSVIRCLILPASRLKTHFLRNMSFFRPWLVKEDRQMRRIAPQMVDELYTNTLARCKCIVTYWELTNTAWPPSTSLRRKRTMLNALCPSRPEVGSSKNSNVGFATSSTPRVTRLRCSMLSPAPGTVNY